jgi:hypothetical protein
MPAANDARTGVTPLTLYQWLQRVCLRPELLLRPAHARFACVNLVRQWWKGDRSTSVQTYLCTAAYPWDHAAMPDIPIQARAEADLVNLLEET